MNRSDFTALTIGVHEARMGLMLTKAHDYATEDILSNFKRMHAYCEAAGIDPRRSAWDCAMFLALLKLDRWCNLVGGEKKPQNESINDTVQDLLNYIDLAHGCWKEQQ